MRRPIMCAVWMIALALSAPAQAESLAADLAATLESKCPRDMRQETCDCIVSGLRRHGEAFDALADAGDGTTAQSAMMGMLWACDGGGSSQATVASPATLPATFADAGERLVAAVDRRTAGLFASLIDDGGLRLSRQGELVATLQRDDQAVVELLEYLADRRSETGTSFADSLGGDEQALRMGFGPYPELDIEFVFEKTAAGLALRAVEIVEREEP